MNIQKEVEVLSDDLNHLIEQDAQLHYFIVIEQRINLLQQKVNLLLIDNMTLDDRITKILLTNLQQKLATMIKSNKKEIQQKSPFIQANNENFQPFRNQQTRIVCLNLQEANYAIDNVLSDLDLVKDINQAIISTLDLDMQKLNLVSENVMTFQKELSFVKAQLSEIIQKLTKGKQKKIILFIILAILLILSVFDFCFRLMQLRVENSTVI